VADPVPPKLPNKAPQALKDFVACTRDDVELDPTDAGWIPKPKDLPDSLTPSVEVEPGAMPNTASVSVGYGFVSLTLPVSVVDGHLQVDASNLGVIDGLPQDIGDWVRQFNDVLDANGKRLDGLTIRNGRIVLHKRPVVAPAPATSQPVAPSPAAGPGPGPATAPPVPAPAPPAAGPSKGCLLGILVALALIAALGVGLFVVARGDDDSSGGPTSAPPSTGSVTSAAGPASSADASTTTAAGSTTPTTSTPTTSTTTTSTTTTAVPVPPRQVCGVGGAGDPGGIPAGTEGTAWGDPMLLAACQAVADEGFPALPPPYRTMAYPPLFVPARQVGVNHQDTVDDAVTGEPGRSEALFNVFATAFAPRSGTLEIASQCGSDVLTGRADLVSDGVTTVHQPLLRFGPCQVVRAFATLEGETFRIPLEAFGQTGLYVVNQNQPPPGDPEITTWDDLVGSARLLTTDDHDLVDLLGAIAGAPLDPDCVSWTAVDPDVFFYDEWNLCAVDGRSRVRLLGVPGSPVFAAGAFANPLGQFMPEDDAFAEFSAWQPLFLDSLFPCGFGQIALTACPEDDAAQDTGQFAVAGVQLPDDVPLDPDDGGLTITVTSVDTGLVWQLAAVQREWTILSDQATSVRAVIRGSSVVFALPQSEVGSAGVTFTVDGGSGPVSGSIPMAGALRTPPVPREAAAVEDLTTFLDRLGASVAAGDGGFAFDRLDPHVFDQFDEAACRTKLEVPLDGFVVELVAQGETGPWPWELPGGTIVQVPSAVYVDAKITQNGVTYDTELHFTVIDGEYHWFAYC